MQSRRLQYQFRDELVARNQAQEERDRMAHHVAERNSALAMMCDVALMANNTNNVEHALVYVLKRVSGHNGWSCGHALVAI